MPTEQTIALPQLILAAVIGGLAIRYFFFPSSSSSSSADAGGSSSNGGGPLSRAPAANRVREEDVERVLQMFPQLQRRVVMWDLQRNGGNIAATTERVLSGRSLETVSCRCPLPLRY